MNIGLTLYGSLDERSGGFRYDRKLVAGLRAEGDTVEVIELPWQAYPRGLLDNCSRRFRSRLEADVDVMLQDELAHPSLFRTNRHLPYPVVSIVHHLRSSEHRRLAPLYRRIEAQYLDTVDAVVCNSGATRRTVTGTGGLRPEETVVAPPAGDRFDPDLSHAYIETRARESPLRLVFVGNVIPRKGLSTLVSGLSRVEADWKLTVVGKPVDGRYQDRVQRKGRRAGIDDRIHLAGELSDSELAALLRQSHVLAVPSRYEGFGIVYLEAMSFGLPPIATSAGGPNEFVTDGETGFLVDPGDTTTVSRAVEKLATDRELLVEMGQAARRRYERQPGWPVTIGRVREGLIDVAEGTSKGGTS